MSFYEAIAERNKECAICGDRPEINEIEQKNYIDTIAAECIYVEDMGRRGADNSAGRRSGNGKRFQKSQERGA